MRKIYFIICFFFGFNAIGQIVITQQGQTESISGGTLQMAAPTHEAFDVPFLVTNNTGNTQRWRVTRLRMNVPTGWTDGLCWGHSTDVFGGICYSSGQMVGNPWTTPGSANIAFDVLNGEQALMKATIDPDNWTSGSAHYRYYISSNGVDYIDSVDLVIDFTASLSPVKESISVSITPNPASDYINISLNGIENAQLRMVDALGSTILKEQLNGNKKINTSEMKSGVYFLVFDIPNSKGITRKVVIRH
jgi:hypothetical protein